MPRSREQENGAAALGREALSEWGAAMRYGTRAVAAMLRERTAGTDGLPQDESAPAGGAASSAVPFPIQESIDVALPVGGAFALASRFLDFPDYLDRVSEAEEVDETHFLFVVRVGRRQHEVEAEIIEEVPDRRIEWECGGELGHSGMLTFHPLAPSLTRIELTIERRPQGLSERLWRLSRLTGAAIQGELHRFKAHVERLDEEFDDYVPQTETSSEEEPQEGAEESQEDEEPSAEEAEAADEEPSAEEAGELDQEAPAEEAEPPDEGQVEEEELEPA